MQTLTRLAIDAAKFAAAATATHVVAGLLGAVAGAVVEVATGGHGKTIVVLVYGTLVLGVALVFVCRNDD